MADTMNQVMAQINVEFGCGGNRLPGWIGHDIAIDGVDITKPLPYDNDSVDNIRAEHVCEHVSGPDFLRFLDECYRILKPGGYIRLCMPVLDNYGNWDRHGRRMSRQHARDLVLNHGHCAAYTGELMRMYVSIAGFDGILIGSMRDETDQHWKAIGKEKDDLETYRLSVFKPVKPSSHPLDRSPAPLTDAPPGVVADGTGTSPECSKP
jgi:predicted SAM-dependent methyltransferase